MIANPRSNTSRPRLQPTNVSPKDISRETLKPPFWAEHWAELNARDYGAKDPHGGTRSNVKSCLPAHAPFSVPRAGLQPRAPTAEAGAEASNVRRCAPSSCEPAGTPPTGVRSLGERQSSAPPPPGESVPRSRFILRPPVKVHR